MFEAFSVLRVPAVQAPLPSPIETGNPDRLDDAGIFAILVAWQGALLAPQSEGERRVQHADRIIARQVLEENRELRVVAIPDNTSGDMDCVKSMGSDIIDVAGANRGDNTISYLDALLSASYDNSQDTREGFILGSVSEFIRDNTLTGGVSGWSTFSFDNGDAVSHAAAVTGGATAAPIRPGAPAVKPVKRTQSKKRRPAKTAATVLAKGGGQPLRFDVTKQRSAKASATAARLKLDGKLTRRGGHVLAAGKRRQAARDRRGR
jgi:hypothetical protein